MKEKTGSQTDLFSGSEKKVPQYQPPPNLRRVYSLSCSMPAREFFRIVRSESIQAILDTRINRTYRGRGFSTLEDDFRYLCEVHDVAYFVVESLSPRNEIRQRFARDFKEVKRAADRNPRAWTEFLEGYEARLQQRRPLRSGLLHNILYGDYEAVAIICSCRHHDDCHRSFATGLIATLLTGVEQRVVYPGDREPPKASPRRYRLRDFPWAGLKANDSTRRRG